MGGAKDRIQLTRPSDLAVPAIAMYELEFGTRRSRNPNQRQRELDRLLSLISVLPFDSRAAALAARVLFELAGSGTQIGPLDTLLAGTVLAQGAILVTHNVEEFSRVPGLQFEDWY